MPAVNETRKKQKKAKAAKLRERMNNNSTNSSSSSNSRPQYKITFRLLEAIAFRGMFRLVEDVRIKAKRLPLVIEFYIFAQQFEGPIFCFVLFRE